MYVCVCNYYKLSKEHPHSPPKIKLNNKQLLAQGPRKHGLDDQQRKNLSYHPALFANRGTTGYPPYNQDTRPK